MIKDNLHLIWNRNLEIKGWCLDEKLQSLYFLGDILFRLHHFRLSKQMFRLLISKTIKNPDATYLRRQAEIRIANCNLGIGNKEKSERGFDKLLQEDEFGDDPLEMESRASALTNAIFAYILTDNCSHTRGRV